MIRHLWPLLVGFSFWALAFVAIYALQYLGCFQGWTQATHRASLIVFYFAAVGALVFVLMFQLAWTRRQLSTTLHRLGFAATTAALGATIFTFAPTLVASACV